MSSNSTVGYHTNKSTVEKTTMPNDNTPADYFLKVWNSEAGKAFRKENHNHYSSEIPLSSVSSLYCASTQNSYDQSLNPKDKHKDNGSQQCNSPSFEWIGDCNVKTHEVLSCFADMTMGQTEDNTLEELDFPELLLDFSDNDDNTNSIQSELSTAFQRQCSSPWPELHDQDHWSNLSFITHASSHLCDQ